MFEDLGYECNDYSDKPKEDDLYAVNKQIEELRMNKKKESPLYKEGTLSKELLDKIFPVGCIYNILYDLWGDEEEQIKNGLEKLNNMIGEREYFGILYAGLAICFKRKK